MNIFALSHRQADCARGLDDKRVGKLLMETNQLLSIAITVGDVAPKPIKEDYGTGRLTNVGKGYINHPVAVWVRANESNFVWTSLLAISLRDEFHMRFGKEHASGDRSNYIFHNFTKYVWDEDYPMPKMDYEFQNSARHTGKGLDFTHLPTFMAYRTYLHARWMTDKRAPTWTNVAAPDWVFDMEISGERSAAREALRAAGMEVA